MFSFIKNFDYVEYIPIAFIGLLFIELEFLHKKALLISCQLVITIICSFLFFFLVLRMQLHRYLAFMIVTLCWILMIYIKRNFISI
jgi:hypothetical protein